MPILTDNDKTVVAEITKMLPDNLDPDDFGRAVDVVKLAFLAGRSAAAPGGLDGMTVSFGDGCDDGRLNTFFNMSRGGWTVDITTADGTFTVQALRFTCGPTGWMVLEYLPWDDEVGEGVPPSKTVPVADITAITVH